MSGVRIFSRTSKDFMESICKVFFCFKGNTVTLSISFKAKRALKNRTLFAHEGVKKIVAKGQRNPLGTAKYEDIYYKEAIHYKIRFCKDNLNKMFIVIIFIFTFVYAKIVRIRNVSASERGITYE